MRRRWAAAWLLALCACNPQGPKPTTGPSATPSRAATAPPLHITGSGTASQPVRMFQQIHNRIEYELIATSYESKGPQGKARAVARNATVTFHDANGGTMTAKAPQAIVDETTNSITMIDGVLARSQSGMTLQCDRLTYDHATQMMHGSGNVTILDPHGFKATGSAFDSDVSLIHVRMH